MGLKLEILLYLLASKVARMTGLCHQAFHFNDCVYVVKVCAQLCLLWRSEVNINVFLYLFFNSVLKTGFPLNMELTISAIMAGQQVPGIYLSACLGMGLHMGTQLLCVR